MRICDGTLYSLHELVAETCDDPVTSGGLMGVERAPRELIMKCFPERITAKTENACLGSLELSVQGLKPGSGVLSHPEILPLQIFE